MIITLSFKEKMICNMISHHLQRLTNFRITCFITHKNLLEVRNKTEMSMDILTFLFNNTHRRKLYFIYFHARIHASFYKQRFFSTQPHCCLTFSWIELQMFLRCGLIPITIIIMKHILYLVCLCPCLGLGLFMPSLCDLLFIFSLIFSIINHITSFQ